MKFAIIFAFILAVIAVAFAAPEQHLLGSEKCTYGPAYWCDSHENAVKCQALEHCQTKVWNKLQPTNL